MVPFARVKTLDRCLLCPLPDRAERHCEAWSSATEKNRPEYALRNGAMTVRCCRTTH
jgi:hypothetical protein